MGKFERKIKNKLKKDTEDFNVWFDKNKNQLSGFDNDERCSNFSGSNVIAKNFKPAILISACLCLAILSMIICFAIIFNNKSSRNLTFGDESVYAVTMSDEEVQPIIKEYPFINNMQITAKNNLLLRENDSLVFAIIDGEKETLNDYYFIRIQIEYNKNYEFGYKTVYKELENETTTEEWNITYGQGLNDSNDLYVYYLCLEKTNDRVIYMEVHCFENDISYIIDSFIVG